MMTDIEPHFPEGLKEERDHQEELQSSTAASNLNKSIDNISPRNLKSALDLGEEVQPQCRRKLSAPISIPQNIGLLINRLGQGLRGSYYSKLISKGLLC
jgi:hypothetical protein